MLEHSAKRRCLLLRRLTETGAVFNSLYGTGATHSMSWRPLSRHRPGQRTRENLLGWWETRNDLLSFFQSGLARLARAKPDWKKERLGVGWRLPRAAAAAALPWAIFLPPLSGLGPSRRYGEHVGRTIWLLATPDSRVCGNRTPLARRTRAGLLAYDAAGV